MHMYIHMWSHACHMHMWSHACHMHILQGTCILPMQSGRGGLSMWHACPTNTIIMHVCMPLVCRATNTRTSTSSLKVHWSTPAETSGRWFMKGTPPALLCSLAWSRMKRWEQWPTVSRFIAPRQMDGFLFTLLKISLNIWSTWQLLVGEWCVVPNWYPLPCICLLWACSRRCVISTGPRGESRATVNFPSVFWSSPCMTAIWRGPTASLTPRFEACACS